MLKVFLGFVVSVVVLLSSAYVGPPTYAASAGIMITQIQAGAVGAATQEFIVIYNNSPDDLDITNWCLTNKNDAKIACFNTGTIRGIYLPPYAHATAVSNSLAATMPTSAVTTTYTPLSQSSGSITGSADTVTLIDSLGNVIDRQSWTTSLASGMQFERFGSGSPVVYIDTDSAADWRVTLPGALPVDESQIDDTIVDVCPNIDDIQPNTPVGMTVNVAGECVAPPPIQIDITEIFPNAAGGDEGHEFIELYNPNDVALDLTNYKMYVGANYENAYNFPADSIIQPHAYVSFSNSDIPYTLVNTSSHVLLALQNGTVVSEADEYTNPKDDQSWALIDGVWQYTSYPTPGAVNTSVGDETTQTEADTSSSQPCAANQYRSPETNRCRLLTTAAASTATPCKDGQYRSEETNRCRNIATDAKTITPCDADEERNLDTGRCRKIVAASTPAPCKEGQERSTDTNRCRTITKMPNADYGVLGAETKSGGNWYAVAAIVGVLLLALGYAIWEWHTEIGKFFKKRFGFIARFARIRK
jgi:hypothetical protein